MDTKSLLLIVSLFFASYGAIGQTEFTLEPAQSMLMTGKGPGQDATVNPYEGEDCYAIVKNVGKRSFSIRVQQKGKIIEEITVRKKEGKKVKLLRGYELYLDPNPEGTARALVDYEKIEE